MSQERQSQPARTPQSAQDSGRVGVRWLEVGERGDGQRLDNFALRELGTVPKTRVYRAIRKGEIRVNKRRAKPEQRLVASDVVRLPPLGAAQEAEPSVAPAGWQERLARSLVHEDDRLLVINKPSGLAVHGGSGLAFGLIETLRAMRPQDRFLELVHRLDRETSGLVLVARKPAALRELHALLRERGRVEKRYLALVAGRWPRAVRTVEAPLARHTRGSGERIVTVARGGKASVTEFRVARQSARLSLVEAMPVTGRTHQIRVHAQHAGHPILGDDKYYSEASRALARELGLARLFLHASRLEFSLDGERYRLEAPLGDELEKILKKAFN